jgi:hypothetical protein
MAVMHVLRVLYFHPHSVLSLFLFFIVQSASYHVRSGGKHFFGLMIDPAAGRVEFVADDSVAADAFKGFLARHTPDIIAVLNASSRSVDGMLATADQRNPLILTGDAIDKLETAANDAMRVDRCSFQRTSMGHMVARVRSEFWFPPTADNRPAIKSRPFFTRSVGRFFTSTFCIFSSLFNLQVLHSLRRLRVRAIVLHLCLGTGSPRLLCSTQTAHRGTPCPCQHACRSWRRTQHGPSCRHTQTTRTTTAGSVRRIFSAEVSSALQQGSLQLVLSTHRYSYLELFTC